MGRWTGGLTGSWTGGWAGVGGRGWAALGLMAASGFAGLGYQIVWTQQASLWLGHEAAAVLAVVTAFFGGLAAGALLLAPRIERSARPARWYAACEMAVATWSLLLAAAMAPVSGWLLAATGAQPSPAWQGLVAFCGTFLLLLPATAAMGATLPAMARVLATLRWQGQSIAALYACNTAGAVLGVLATAFWLVPAVGLVRTAVLCAALNAACAAGAWLLARTPTAMCRPVPPMPMPMPMPMAMATATATAMASPSSPSPDPRPPSRRLLAVLATSGLLGIGLEVLVVRVLSQVTEDTVYTFALLLATYLMGTALGAAIHQRRQGRVVVAAVGQHAMTDRLLCLLALTCLLASGSLWTAGWAASAMQHTLGASMAGALAAEAALALLAFGLPTVVMGLLFSELSTQASAAGVGVGRCLAVNTAGAAIAPLVFGLWLAPALGPKPALLLVAVGYLALVSRCGWRTAAVAVPGGAVMVAVLVLALWAPPLAFVDVPAGGRVVSYRNGALAAVSVVEDAAGVSRLRINNRQQEGSSASLLADGRQALLPLLLHPAPRRALFLGLGTGMTAATATLDPTLEVDAVELLPDVIAVSPAFTRTLTDGAANPRLHLLAGDARRFVKVGGQRYDVIVSDNFHPARSGSGALYTVEHFRAVHARLAAGGLFCQWLPLHQLDLQTLRSIVQAFMAANPGGRALLATNSLQTPVLGLLAQADAGGRFDPGALHRRMAASTWPLADFGLADEMALLGSFVAGPRALLRFAGNAAVNTDDHPVVAYAAPRLTYAPESTPDARLVDLLQQLALAPAELVAAGAEPAWQQRLAAYWTARDRFIAAGRGVQLSSNPGQMLAQVLHPLLAVLRISPDFRPAYDPLLAMALALARTDAVEARAVLDALARAQPARPEAARALLQLAGGMPAPCCTER